MGLVQEDPHVFACSRSKGMEKAQLTQLGSKREKGCRKKLSLATKGAVGTRGKRRWHPGTVALREIRKFQQGTGLLIAKAPFRRLVKEAIRNLSPDGKISATAVIALQEAAEMAVIRLLEDSKLICHHGRRETICCKDIWLAQRLRGERK